jgi:hypothetical protein
MQRGQAMKFRIVRDREGAIVAAVEVPEAVSGITASAEPEMKEGYQVEEIEVPPSVLLDPENFFRTHDKVKRSQEG